MLKRSKRLAKLSQLLLVALSLGLMTACATSTPTSTASLNSAQGALIAYDAAYASPQAAASATPAGDLPTATETPNTEEYKHIYENPFLNALNNPLSTFSIDVDTASYSNARRFIEQQNSLPPADAVRIEEFLNYFRYDFAPPTGDLPFALSTELSDCPWQSGHQLLQIGLQAKTVDTADLPRSNLVFLLDVSGSMEAPHKLPLLKQSLRLLVDQLRENDKVSIVVYAGAAGQVLPPTSGDHKETILAALDNLQAGGSTAGAAGLNLAYQVAQQNFIPGGNNRVILATDGDFNVGPSSDAELTRLIEDKRKAGIFLTTLGFGMGNYKDSKMEQLADKGNGNYAYIDTVQEARKVLVEEMGGTLLTLAKDVKLQLEFNPAKVKEYRLIGYENRLLAAEDFNDDSKDAGELGAGHTVTALYELVPASTETVKAEAFASDDLLTLKLRYKAPDADQSELLSKTVKDQVEPLSEASQDLHFAASVAGFGMLLRDSEYKGDLNYAKVLQWGQEGLGEDKGNYRKAYLELVQKAQQLAQP